MKITGVAITLLSIVVCSAQLPEESAELVRKLNSWELDQQAALKTAIAAKRSEVARLLAKKLEDATTSGDLDGALAIRQEIERLVPAENPYPGSIQFNGHYYKVLTKTASWKDAISQCKSLDAKISMPVSEEENAFLSELAKKAGFDTLWLGTTDEKVEGTWIWENAPIKFAKWDKGQPNDGGGIEDNAVIFSLDSGLWWDVPSDTLAQPPSKRKVIPGVICQWE